MNQRYLIRKTPFLTLLLLCPFLVLSQPTSQTFNSSGTYTIPAGYNAQVKVEAWGGGAGGGGGTGNERGGGGGGAYSSSTLSLATGSYTVTVGAGGVVGAAGGVSNFNSQVIAAGGGSTTSTTGGSGGTIAASTGTVKFAGGNGGNSFNLGGGGGGGASATAVAMGGSGLTGTTNTGGAGGVGEGNGGAGANDNPPSDAGAGSAPGGAGGGRAKNNGTISAAGAAGRVTVTVISFALPIELKSFTAIQEQGKVSITFSTATERNNAYFSIERSPDGARFESIGQVTGAGNSNVRQDYTYTDEYPVKGVNFYRLKQVDFDGAFAYSPVVSVSFGQIGGLYLSPLPVLDQLTVTLEQAVEQNSQWQVYDFAGRLLQSGILEAESSDFQIPTNTLTEGAYVLRVVSGQTVLTRQFQKQ